MDTPGNGRELVKWTGIITGLVAGCGRRLEPLELSDDHGNTTGH